MTCALVSSYLLKLDEDLARSFGMATSITKITVSSTFYNRLECELLMDRRFTYPTSINHAICFPVRPAMIVSRGSLKITLNTSRGRIDIIKEPGQDYCVGCASCATPCGGHKK